ncbi:MAG: cupin domain-containing protein [Fodinibius sp.]|nr:cupin domain-containing protein [Fodinibius sp.]
MAQPTYKQIVDDLELSPHPEGGYYKEIYRSDHRVQRDEGAARSAGTGIYFLLPDQLCTNWHRVASDELWHFYRGDKLVLEIIDANGDFKQLLLADEIETDGSYQALVPRNCWQRAYSTGLYSLVGCTVSPGFEFDDFEMIEPEVLAERHPDIAEEITGDPF